MIYNQKGVKMPEYANCISVVTTVFNEELRIEMLLKCLSWCDDIIVVDKSSSDRTREIALRYTDKVITVPFGDACDVGKCGIHAARHEWIMGMTASDVIHPVLVDKLQALLRQDPFPYDIVALPYVVHVFGIHSKHSPWHMPTKKSLFRKSVVRTRNEVHRETYFTSKRIYKMRPNDTEALFHLTHPTMDFFFKRTLQYCHAEPTKYPNRTSGLCKTFGEVILAVGWLIMYKRVFMLGWNGIALGLGFLVYYATKFLYVWEKFHGDPGYEEIKLRLVREWEKRGTISAN
jgi:glycosyltransferase involved in cell wall biosynthesis